MAANQTTQIGGLNVGGGGGGITTITGGTANGFNVEVAGTTTTNIAVKTTGTAARALYNGASNALGSSAGLTMDAANVLSMDVAGTANINATGTGATNIGTSATAGTLAMGHAAGVTTIEGVTTINGTSTDNTTIGTSGAGAVLVRGSTIGLTGTTNTLTGITNINNTGGAATNIGTSATAGTVTIGASGRTITTIGTLGHTGTYGLTGTGTLTGTTNVVGATNINTTGSSATSIGTSASAGNVTIGNTGGLNTITGPTNIDGNVAINNNVTLGTTNIGTHATAGTVTIGHTGGTLATIGSHGHTGAVVINGVSGNDLQVNTSPTGTIQLRTTTNSNTAPVTTTSKVTSITNADANVTDIVLTSSGTVAANLAVTETVQIGALGVVGKTTTRILNASTGESNIVFSLKDSGALYEMLTLLSTGGISIKNGNGGNVVSLVPGTSTTTFTLKLPTADGTSNQVMKTDGSGNLGWTTVGSGGIGTSVSVYKSADEVVNSSTALQDDDELTFSIGANETYKALFCLHLYAHASAGFKMDFTAPAGATGRMMIKCATANYQLNNTAIGTGFGTTTAIAATTGAVFVTLSIVNSSTAGTVSLRFAQNASFGADTLIKAGSYMNATRVA